MHQCPECGQACYCDLDDSNDCRDDGECFHGCNPEDDADEGWGWEECQCAACRLGPSPGDADETGGKP